MGSGSSIGFGVVKISFNVLRCVVVSSDSKLVSVESNIPPVSKIVVDCVVVAEI